MSANDFCACGQIMPGVDPCVREAKSYSGLIFVKTVADDGTKNSLDPATLTPAIIEANINNADLSKRWYYFDSIEEVDYLPNEPVIETSSKGTNYIVDKKQVFNFSGEKWGAVTAHTGALNDSFCNGFSVYYIGDEELLIGNELDGLLYPRSISKGSLFFNVLSTKKGDTNNKMGIQFTESRKESAKTLAQVLLSEEGVAELVEVKSVSFSEISTGSNTIVVSGVMPYSNLNQVIYYTEALVADWTLTSNDVAQTVDSVTVADNAGVCEITITWSGAALDADPYKLEFVHNGLYASPVTGTLTV